MNRKKIKSILSHKVLLSDGAMGTELINRGFGDFPPEVYVLRNRDAILGIQKDYVNAGCDILLTATFGANPIKLENFHLENQTERINATAVDIAREAASGEVLVAGDIGPTGSFFPPSGNLTFSTAYKVFSKQAKALHQKGVDLFILETFSDIRELKAAFFSIRDISPHSFIIVNLTMEKDGRTLVGTDPAGFSLAFGDLDVDGLGINCSLGPEKILPIFQELCGISDKYLNIKPNAGMPEIVDGKTVYRMDPAQFAKYGEDFYEMGANIIGGCCGTGPLHIKKLVKKIKGKTPQKRRVKSIIGLSSLSKKSVFTSNTNPVIIGERINPTGKKKMTLEIERGATKTILKEAKKQAEAGASVLDLNLGMESGITEQWTKTLITNLQASPGLPISLDIRRTDLIQASLQEYGGRALLNSITLDDEDMKKKVNLLLKYGGMAVFLPIDKDGIPTTVERREKVLNTALKTFDDMGLNKQRILFDPIVMSLATGSNPTLTLETLRLYKSMGLLTIIGLSNISYGLPHRASINNYFLNLCRQIGVDAVIMNPIEKSVSTDADLSPIFTGEKNVKQFLDEIKLKEKRKKVKEYKKEDNLSQAILDGEKEKTLSIVKKMLKKTDFEKVIENYLRPALDKVGERYNKREIFLPELILSAEAAQSAFKYIENTFQKESKGEGKVVIATVRGDIHDIGKNIVAMMLKNAGFDVTDLGKDVPSKEIIQTAEEINANIIALSALLTTSALKMKEVVNMVKKKNIPTKVIIGGACITQKFANEIGADAYGYDASSAVSETSRLMGSAVKSA
jgi:5-methyltetrahydrofolate--homocysteine methyltransferase